MEKEKDRMNIHGVPYFFIEPKDGSKPAGFYGAQPRIDRRIFARGSRKLEMDKRAKKAVLLY